MLPKEGRQWYQALEPIKLIITIAVAVKITFSQRYTKLFTPKKSMLREIDNDGKHQTRPDGCDKKNQFNG